jgi:protein gp37
MNRTSIEWCDYTWNPVSGCLHRCRDVYCYNTMKATAPLNRFGARYIDGSGRPVYEKDWKARETGECHIAKEGEIYPYGYDPTLYPHRLDEPLRVRKPGRIFVVDTGDLFGRWVPAEWIEQVIDAARRCPQHTFQFLTKNPKRLLDFEFPENAWVGTSVNSGKDKGMAEVLKKASAPVRFLSIEPLLGRVSFDLEGLQWLIIGAQTGKDPVRPEREWVEDILSMAGKLRIPVFLKDNIAHVYPKPGKEYPQKKTPQHNAGGLLFGVSARMCP